MRRESNICELMIRMMSNKIKWMKAPLEGAASPTIYNTKQIINRMISY